MDGPKRNIGADRVGCGWSLQDLGTVCRSLPAAACTTGVGPEPLLGYNLLEASAQAKRRRALMASRTQPPRSIAAETFRREERGRWDGDMAITGPMAQ